MAAELRHVVWMPGPPAWELPAVHDGPCISGGHRTLHELAVAIAVTGRRVEVRGRFDLAELRLLSDAAGAGPELPDEPRRPGPGDVILMPEGSAEPLTFGYVALSEARLILLVLAPPGLFGWPFRKGWSLPEPIDVLIDSVARPDHFRAIAAMGFEIWGNSPELVARVEAAGVSGSFIGEGRPVPFPEPSPKRYDVVSLASNRWSGLARDVARRLEPSIVHHEIPDAPHDALLESFGQARILIHPLRIEGHSRIGLEARAMGAVPVVLDTNPFRLGLDEDGGAVAVPTLEEMPSAVMALLDDPDRLEVLRERGMVSARAQADWQGFVDRVDEALSRAPEEDPARQARAVIGDRLRNEEERMLSDLRSLARKRIRSTRAWRLARRFWRARAGAREAAATVRGRSPHQ